MPGAFLEKRGRVSAWVLKQALAWREQGGEQEMAQKGPMPTVG